MDTRNDRKPYWKWDNDNDNMGNLYNGLLRRGLFAPYIDGKPNGTFLAWHPIEVINGNSDYNKKRYSNYEINVALQYDIPFIKGLSLKLSYNRYERHTFIKRFSRPYDLYVFKTTGAHNHIPTNEIDYVKTRDDGNFLYEKYNNDNSYQLNAMVTYNKTFGKHDINALFVYEQYEGTNDWLDGQRNYFISSAVDQIFAGSSDPKNSTLNGSGSEGGRLSYVGRLGYTYDSKYLLEASFRYDGSVNFDPKHRWGFFPSASVAWRISEENFFKNNIGFIDYLKLRGSVGLPGNDAVGGWQWMQRYNLNSGVYFGSLSNGVSASVIPNTEITWEKSLDIDYGFDMQILRNRLSLSVGGFYKHTYDILGDRLASLPSTFGGTMPKENYATIDTKGFEIEFSYKDKIGDDFSYNISGNLGYAVNELITKDEAENIRPYKSELGYNTDRQMGYVATDIIRTQTELDALPEGYTIFGKKPELGMLNYKDIRGANSDEPDGKIDSNDQEWVIKHTKSPINYGFSVGGSWKGLSVDLFFQGVAGGKRFYDKRIEWGGMEETSYAFRADYWTPENTDAKYPAAGWDQDVAGYSDEAYGETGILYEQLTTNSIDTWNYSSIRNINIMLNSIKTGDLDAETKASLRAQALVLRAWRYFQMVRQYGGVPMIMEPQALTDDLYVTRNKTSECINLIIQDLDEAIQDLPWKWTGDDEGRFSKATAIALKGRILLYYASPQFNPENKAERWETAYVYNKKAAEQIETNGYDLYESYENIWFDEMNKEVLFVTRYQEPDIVHHWDAATRPLSEAQNYSGANQPTKEMVESYQMITGVPITESADYDPLHFWRNRDPRFTSTIAYNGCLWELSGKKDRIQWTYQGSSTLNPSASGFYCRKAINVNFTPYDTERSSTDWVEIRFAEVLMNYAECAAETQKYDEAYSVLKRIRKRAGITAGDNNMYGLKENMSHNEMIAAIMLERKIEFAYEGKRYWDLRRRRMFASEMNGIKRHGLLPKLKGSPTEFDNLKDKVDIEKDYTTYFKDSIVVLDQKYEIDFQDNYYFYAIPNKHLEQNSKLQQTQGWDNGTFNPYE